MVQLLAEGDEQLGKKVGGLLDVVGGHRVSGWEEGDVSLMEERLHKLEAALKPQAPASVTSAQAREVGMSPAAEEEAAPGWRRLRMEEWGERPIGWVGA